MKRIFFFVFLVIFIVGQKKSLNKNEVIDIGQLDFFMQRDISFLKKIKKELKNENRISSEIEFNYLSPLSSFSKNKQEEFIDNQFSFLMSHPNYYKIFFNVDRVIKENFYSFFVRTKKLEKTETSRVKNGVVPNSGYNSFNMGTSLEFNLGKTKTDFLFSSTEEGSQKEKPNFNKIFSKKLQLYFYNKDTFVKNLSLDSFFHYGNFYSEPSFSFLSGQQSYLSGKIGLTFNQLKSAYEGWALLFNIYYDNWVKNDDFRLLNDLKINYFFSISDFNFGVSGGIAISINGSNSQLLPNIYLSSELTSLRNMRIILSLRLQSESQRLESYLKSGSYVNAFGYPILDYFFISELKTHLQLNNLLKFSFVPYATFHFIKNINVFDKNNPLFFTVHQESNFFEIGSSFSFQLNLGEIILFNSQVKIRKINYVGRGLEDASYNFDKNVNAPFLVSMNNIVVNLKPIKSKVHFNLYSTVESWIMTSWLSYAHNFAGSQEQDDFYRNKDNLYQKIDSFDFSINYFFQYDMNLSFYVYANNLFDNLVYQINTLKLKRGRNLEFGLEYKF